MFDDILFKIQKDVSYIREYIEQKEQYDVEFWDFVRQFGIVGLGLVATLGIVWFNSNKPST